MSKYRKRPVVIEAFRLGHDNQPDWFCEAKSLNRVITSNLDGRFRGGPDIADILTMEGTMRANFGDWIILGTIGEIYPCKHEVFVGTYEAVE